MKYYTLNDKGTPIHEPDPTKWEDWFSTADRSVARSIIGDSQVSTLFLAYTENDKEANPLLWETAVVGGPLAQVKDHCAGTREQAETMHAKMVERVKSYETAH